MAYETLLAPQTLAAHIADDGWVIVDCRFDLAAPEAGWHDYLAAHIPGSVYAHLDDVLSNPPHLDRGRHPLPAPDQIAGRFSRLGIGNQSQVVAYDGGSGATAARLWWMLRYLGHDSVAVLDGGWAAWQAAKLPVAAGEERNAPAPFRAEPRIHWLVTAAEVSGAALLVDSREPERYRGEVEPLDTVAGHIPGAVNYHYQRNLADGDRFLSPAELHDQLAAVHGSTPPEDVVYYCGSGVTACHNLLAQAHAGLPPGRLYAGSWSDWITDPARPVAGPK